MGKIRNRKSYSFWKEEETKILLENYKILSPKELLVLLPNRTIAGIKRKLKTEKLTEKFQWTNEDKEFLIKNYNVISNGDLVLELKKDPQSIVYWINKLGLDKINYREDGFYSVNHNSFSNINNLESCYWAGFIAADGCITNQQELKITLSTVDKDCLKKLKSFLKFDGPIKDKYRFDDGIERFYSTIRFKSIKICEDLKKHYNIIPRKTKILIPPNLNNLNQILSYISGYVDGDGSVGYHFYDQFFKIQMNGTNELLSFIKEIFDKNFPPIKGATAKVRPSKGIKAYCVNSGRVIQFFNAIKNLNLPLMDRKWKKVFDSVSVGRRN